MSNPFLFSIPESKADTLAQLRARVEAAQAVAVTALLSADNVSGEDNGADQIAISFLAADDVQSRLLVYLSEWQERDESDFSDEDNWGHPEGPLTRDERAMMKAFQNANARLNDLRMAIAALRARELSELQAAGASIGQLPRA